MAWVRLHDGAMTHPKIIGLSDKAFRLWVWGLSYCQQHLTDGAIPSAALPAGMSKAAALLVLAHLWYALEAGGWRVHDYLDWNDSKETVTKKQADARERMALARERRSRDVRANTQERTSSEVPLRFGLSTFRSDPEKEDQGTIAAQFCERFVELYKEHRRGAHYHLKPSLDWTRVCDLLHTWDAARLEKLAVILLTTDDEWIAKTDRGIGVFVVRASWCDDRLKAWETEHGVAV